MSEAESPFAVLHDEQHDANLPVVVLMGWVGATRDGALLKYAELLAKAGYSSCRSVQPTDVAFSPFDSTRRAWAVALLTYLKRQQLWPQRRIILYAFSNGGAFVVEQLLNLAETEPRYAQLPTSIAGIIFDSAPAYTHPGMMQKVIAASEPPSMRRRLKSSYYAAMSALQPLLHPRSPPRFQQFWGNMERLSWGRPLLFLYSADDPLCDAAKVDELVAEKRRRGQDVKARKWERSGHVAHLRHHSDEYTDLLLQFLALTAQDAATGTVAAPTKGAASTGGAVGPRSKL